jgi:hypothetical protein
MLINRIIRDFLLTLFVLYLALNCFYTDGSLVSQMCIVIIILISLIYFIKTLLLTDNNALLYKAWSLLLLLNVAGFILNPDLSQGLSRDMFKNVLGGMLPFFPFYYFAKKGLLKSSHLIIFAIIILPVLILQYIVNERTYLAQADSGSTNMVNNIAYSFASLIPFIFLIRKNNYLSVIMMVVLMFFIIQGAKRGAIIAGFAGLLMYFYYQLKSMDKKKQVVGYLMVLLIICGLGAFTYYTMMSNEFLLGRMTDMLAGDSSRRDVIYKSLFETWYNSDNLFHLIFGYGFAASVKIAGTYAHNDWLELLSNFGIAGVFTYLFLFFTALKCCLNKDWFIEKRTVMMTVTIIWFLITLVSMSYTDQGGFMQAILLGYLVGNKNYYLE